MLTIDDIKSYITPVIKKYPVEKVILIGSYARGDATDSSDVDLIVDSGGHLHNRKIFALGGELLDVLPVRTDVYDVSEIPNQSKMYESILTDGVTIYESAR
jgi:predicted nucleotidyltransferase